MVQFSTQKEVIFVHCCVLQFAYYAVVMAEDFDAMKVCCETVVTLCSAGNLQLFVFCGYFCCFPMWIWCFATVSCWMRQWLPGRIFLDINIMILYKIGQKYQRIYTKNTFM